MTTFAYIGIGLSIFLISLLFKKTRQFLSFIIFDVILEIIESLLD